MSIDSRTILDLTTHLLRAEFNKANQPGQLEAFASRFWAIALTKMIQMSGKEAYLVPEQPPTERDEQGQRNKRKVDIIIEGDFGTAELTPLVFIEIKKAHASRNEVQTVKDQINQACQAYINQRGPRGERLRRVTGVCVRGAPTLHSLITMKTAVSSG